MTFMASMKSLHPSGRHADDGCSVLTISANRSAGLLSDFDSHEVEMPRQGGAGVRGVTDPSRVTQGLLAARNSPRIRSHLLDARAEIPKPVHNARWVGLGRRGAVKSACDPSPGVER